MKHMWTEAKEKEMYRRLIAAIKQAEDEGQPVREIYAAIQAGQDVQIKLEPASAGKVRLIISV